MPKIICPVANKNKDGRHVGLDSYDLLIEALRTPPMSDNAIFANQPSVFSHSGVLRMKEPVRS